MTNYNYVSPDNKRLLNPISAILTKCTTPADSDRCQSEKSHCASPVAHRVVRFCQHVHLSYTQSHCWTCVLLLLHTGSPARPSERLKHTVLPVVCSGNIHDLALSFAASRCQSWKKFLGTLSCWNLISAGPLQPLPVLFHHFGYAARQPTTSLSYVTSGQHCMVLSSLTSMALRPTGGSHC